MINSVKVEEGKVATIIRRKYLNAHHNNECNIFNIDELNLLTIQSDNVNSGRCDDFHFFNPGVPGLTFLGSLKSE